MRIALLLAGLAVLGVIAYGVQQHASQHANDQVQAMQAGFAETNAEQRAENDHLAIENAGKAMQIIELTREGYGKATPAELRDYIRILQSAAPLADPAYQHDLARDIAWCQRKLKTAR